jgi:hypothetical protein
MAWKRFGGLGVVAVLLASSGCCWWCDHWCPHSQAVAYPSQACAPCCCSGPAYASAPATLPPVQANAAPPAGWNNPQGPSVLYRTGNGCYCEQPPPH